MGKAKYQDWIGEIGLGKIREWAEDGLEDKQIAELMNVAESTFRDWKKKYPPIVAALECGRGGARVQIQNALYERAKGGVKALKKPMKLRKREYDPVTKRCIREEEVVEIVEEEFYFPPDTNAAKYWLNNRAPERWSGQGGEESGGESLEEILAKAAREREAAGHA